MNKRVGVLFIVIMTVGMLFQQTVFAKSDAVTGVVEEVTGDVMYQKNGAFRALPLAQGEVIQPGDIVTTKANATIKIQLLPSDDTLYVSSNTEFYFLQDEDHVVVYLLSGDVYGVATERNSIDEALYIKTNETTYEVLGTNFFVGLDSDQASYIYIMSGIVRFRDDDDSNDSNYVNPGLMHFHDPERNEEITKIIDIEFLLERADSYIINAILENADQIRKENNEFIENVMNSPTGEGDVNYTGDDLEKYQANIRSIVNHMIRQAMDSDKITVEDIERLLINNEKLIDILNFDELPPYYEAITASDVEKQARLKRIREERHEAERILREDLQQRHEQEQQLLNELQLKRDEQIKRQQEEMERIKEERIRQLGLDRPMPPRPGSGSGSGGSSPPRDPEREIGDIKLTKLNVTTDVIDFSWAQEYGEGDFNVSFTLSEGDYPTPEVSGSTATINGFMAETEYTLKIERSGKTFEMGIRTLPYENAISVDDDSNNGFELDLTWHAITEVDTYHLYVDDELISDNVSTNAYKLENLQPNETYDVRVEVFYEGLPHAIAAYQRDVTAKELENITIQRDWYMLVVEEPIGEIQAYEIKINGEIINEIDEENIQLDLTAYEDQLTENVNKLEIIGLKDGSYVAYGYANISKVLNNDRNLQLGYYESDFAILLWDVNGFAIGGLEAAEFSAEEPGPLTWPSDIKVVYREVTDEGEGSEVNLEQMVYPYIFLTDLNPHTTYVVESYVEGEHQSELEFTTGPSKRMSNIFYEDTMIKMDLGFPDDVVGYNVFIDGQNAKADQFQEVLSVESGSLQFNESAIGGLNSPIITIRVELYDGDGKLIDKYEETRLIIPITVEVLV